LLLAVAFQPNTARAGLGWCAGDPVIVVDGQLVDLLVSVMIDDLLKVNGPTQIVVTVPKGIDAMLLVASPGFGYGEEVSFDQSPSLKATAEGIEMRVEVYLPASDDAMPVRLQIAPRVIGLLHPATTEDTANNWFHLETSL
jgi:hypothetical protein